MGSEDLGIVVAVGAHGEAFGEEDDFWEGSGHVRSQSSFSDAGT
jgi:hypothetical protein